MDSFEGNADVQSSGGLNSIEIIGDFKSISKNGTSLKIETANGFVNYLNQYSDIGELNADGVLTFVTILSEEGRVVRKISLNPDYQEGVDFVLEPNQAIGSSEWFDTALAGNFDNLDINKFSFSFSISSDEVEPDLINLKYDNDIIWSGSRKSVSEFILPGENSVKVINGDIVDPSTGELVIFQV